MITKRTAYDIWIAYDEIAKGEKLMADMEEQRSRGESVNLRDGFGRPRSLQLGVPSGETSQRLFGVPPALAIAVISAHVAQKKAELMMLNVRAGAEAEAGRMAVVPVAETVAILPLLGVGAGSDAVVTRS